MKRTFFGLVLAAIFVIAVIWTIGGWQEHRSTKTDRPIDFPQDEGNTPAVAGQMIGKNVQNQQGQGLGRVVALVTREGHIAYILMSKLDGRDWVPIPPGAAYLNPRQNAVILRNVDIAAMSNAPALSPDDLEMLHDPEFESRIHSYYGKDAGRSGDSRKPRWP